MAKGTRLPEATKVDIAERYQSGGKTKQEVKELAERFGISPSTVMDYASRFGKPKKARVKRKVTVQKTPKENTRVSDEMITGLKKQIEFWKDAFLTEFQKNRNG